MVGHAATVRDPNVPPLELLVMVAATLIAYFVV